MKLLAKGDVNGALAQLELMDIDQIVNRQTTEINQLHNNAEHMQMWLNDIYQQSVRIKTSIDNKVSLIELQNTEKANLQAINLLEKAIRSDNYNDMDWMTRITALCYKQRQYSRLMHTLKQYLVNPHTSTLDSVRVLSNLANCQRREGLDNEYRVSVNCVDSLLSILEPQMGQTTIWNLCEALLCVHRSYIYSPQELEIVSDSLFGHATTKQTNMH